VKSPFGPVKLLTPLFSSSGLEDAQFFQVVDTIRANDLFRRMRKEKSIEFIVPEAQHSKMIAIYKNLKYKWKKIHPNYGDKSPKEIFHLYRRFKQDRNHFFGRFGFIISENYQIKLKYPPDVSIMPSAIRTFIDEPNSVFMPMNLWEGILSTNEWNSKGLPIEALEETIHPLYGVWSPTNQEFLNLFKKYLDSTELQGTAIDLGCGTGVLGFMLAKKGMQVFGVDSLFQAAKCTNLNAQKLELDVNAVHDDANKVDLPMCDVIVCNPPWIPVSKKTALDSGVYDPNESLLKAAFMQTKKLNAKGKLLLFYSDFASKIGLQKENRIDELCQSNQMKIANRLEINFPYTTDTDHPLKKFKDSSHIYLYEIIRDL